MSHDSAAIETAVRVLNAFLGGRRPDTAIVQELRRYAPAGTQILPPDELACEVIRRRAPIEWQQSRRERRRGAGGSRHTCDAAWSRRESLRELTRLSKRNYQFPDHRLIESECVEPR